jgi:hypothetical protein
LRLPPEALKKLFYARLKRGSIIKAPTEFQDTGTTKDKYLVLVSADKGDDPLYFFISSSQLAYYERHPALKSDALFIDPGTLDCFPARTVINCREIYPVDRGNLDDLAEVGRVTVVGDLPEALLSQLDRIVAQSKLISAADKKKILG